MTPAFPFDVAPALFWTVLGALTDYVMHVGILGLPDASLTSRFQLLVSSPVLHVNGSFCSFKRTVLLPSQPSSFSVHPGVCGSGPCVL